MKDQSCEHLDAFDYAMAERIQKQVEQRFERDAERQMMEQWTIPVEQLDPEKVANSFSEISRAMQTSREQWQKFADTLSIASKSIPTLDVGNAFEDCVYQEHKAEEKPKKEKFHVPRKVRKELDEKFTKKVSKLCEKHSIEQLLTHDDPLIREMASAFYRNINRDTASTSESTSKCGDGEAPEKTTASVRA